MYKVFILDTNVLLYDSGAIFKFEEHTVIIPMTVVEEIDRFKKEMNELGRNARQFSRVIDELRSAGNLTLGVPVNDKDGKLRVVICDDEATRLLPEEMDASVNDNRILAVALLAKAQYINQETILITKDTNLRIKADCVGLRAEDYSCGAVDYETLYNGATSEYEEGRSLSPNEFVIGEDQEIRRFEPSDTVGVPGILKPIVEVTEESAPWGLVPRNDEQRMALDLLLDDSIKLVTLVGKAGTGKTLLAIAAGLHKVTPEFKYQKLLVSRPVMPMGNDIGFLPGDVNEKLAPYMQPIYDNVEFLMAGYRITSSPSATTVREVKRVKKAKKQGKKQPKENDQYAKFSNDDDEKNDGMLDKGYKELLAAGIMEVEPLTYIRGRSIPNQYLIVDEAQNLTPHEVKTIITRAGEGTKIVLTGDPQQIDCPYLDASSNGLSYVVEKMRSERIAGHITLTKGERSELAEIASGVL